ncbi:MAG: mobile mystery protein B [Alphaproteobacteria bacterium]|nr:mobile mystery protein B [Alphaproteobacteria bacterium]
MNDLFAPADDAGTPLAPEEKRDLIPAHIAFRGEINAAEQDNIARGQEWALRQRREILDERFLLALHRRMFGEVWRWAGRYRSSERNLGVAPWEIPVETRKLVDDARTWIAQAAYRRDEIAVRLHHRLVWIHPFANGNGRHARLVADLLILRLGGERFTWGRGSLYSAGELRQRYIAALRAADRHELATLVAFARS